MLVSSTQWQCCALLWLLLVTAIGLATQDEASLSSDNGKDLAPEAKHAEGSKLQKQATNIGVLTQPSNNQGDSPALPEPRGNDIQFREPRDADSDPDPIRDIRPIPPVTMQSVKLYTSATEEAATGASWHNLESMYLVEWVYKYVHTYVQLSILTMITTNWLHPGYGARVAGIKALAFNYIISTLPASHAQTLIGYDTAGRFSDEKITMKTISLLGVESCSTVQTQSYSPPTEHNVQVIYKPSESTIIVLQCSIKLTVDVYPCSETLFRTDTYPSDTIDRSRILPLNGEDCRAMYTKGSTDIDIYGTIVRLDRVTHNTNIKSKTIIGTKKQDGGCKGGTIQINNVKREGVVVIATIEFFAKEWRATFSPSANRVHVGDLVTFAPSEKPNGSCDSEYGCFYTKSPDGIPTDECERTLPFLKGKALVYEPATDSDLTMQGHLDIIQITSNQDESQGTTLTLGDSAVICNTLVRKTNIPRLFVNFYEDPGNNLIKHRLSNRSLVANNQYQMIDILSSSSNLYLRGTLSISDQFDRVSFRLCELRRAALLGILRDLLTSGPAPLLDYREGILFRRVGSVVYIFMGNPITCRLRPTEECYNEIPVFLTTNDKEIPAFLTSKGRIIVNNATVIKCSDNQAMHFIRNDEMARMNRTLTLFQDTALSDTEETEMEGSWLCQYPGQFVHCNPPSSLSPSIGVSDHFLGIKGKFITQSIFGHEGRENLYKTQTEGFNRNVLWNTFTHSTNEDFSSSAGDIILSNLSMDAQRKIRSIVLPTIVLIFGDFSTSVGQFLITAYILSVIYWLICLIGRVVMVFKNKGCSRHIIICFFEGIYNAVIPWRAAVQEREKSLKEMSAKLEQQAEDLRNLWALHFMPKASEPLTIPRSPLARARQLGLGRYPLLDGEISETAPLAGLGDSSK